MYHKSRRFYGSNTKFYYNYKTNLLKNQGNIGKQEQILEKLRLREAPSGTPKRSGMGKTFPAGRGLFRTELYKI